MEFEVDDYTANWLRFGYIGGIVTTVILAIFLVHCVSKYYKLYIRASVVTPDESLRWVHLLSIAYFLSGLIACSVYIALRGRMSSSFEFTLSRCQAGYMSSVLLYAAHRILFYIVAVHQIRVTFVHFTKFKYQPMLFVCLYWLISVIASLYCIFWIISQRHSVWFVVSNESQTFSFCTVVDHDTHSNESSVHVWRVFLMMIEISFKLFLLYLFWTRLFKIYDTLARIEEHYKPIASQNEDMQVVHSQEDIDEKEDSEEDKIYRNSLQHQNLVRLCEVTKKNTILLFFGISSTFVYYMFAAIRFEGATLLNWDVMINALCVWLMLTFSQKYWMCCTRFGCCCCCYISQNLDDFLSQA